MAIVWTTTAGSLGTIEERVAYTKTLTATGATSGMISAGTKSKSKERVGH